MRTSAKVLALALVLMTIGCDRVTKHVASTKLVGVSTQSFFADTVRLEYAENSGAFLGLGSQLPEWARFVLFKGGVGLALAGIAFVAVKYRWTGLLLVGASLTFAGGVSNLVDRIARGSVVDFMSVGIGPLWTGIFNVADVAVMLGAALIVIGGYENPRKE